MAWTLREPGTVGAPDPTVLIVDDDDVWRSTLKHSLEREGFHVVGCSRGDWATSAVKTHHPDVLVLDVNLPGTSGFEVLRAVHYRWPDVPVIVMTAFGGANTAASAQRDGASGYLDKPFRIARLVEEIRRVTGGRAGRQKKGSA